MEAITWGKMLAAAGSGLALPNINKILGPAADEVGAMFGDRVRLYRLENSIRNFKRVQEMVEDAGFEPKQISIKTMFPLLEGASLEESPELTEKWAALLANAADPENRIEVNPSYAEILKQLTPSEAELLDRIFLVADADDPSTNGKPEPYPVENRPFIRQARAVGTKMNLQQFTPPRITFPPTYPATDSFNIMVDSLIRQRLIIQVMTVAGNPDASSQTISMSEISFSALGFGFMLACTPPTRAS